MSKRDSNVPYHSGFHGSTSNGKTKVTNVKKIWMKKNELIALLSTPHLKLVSHTHGTLIVVAHVI